MTTYVYRNRGTLDMSPASFPWLEIPRLGFSFRKHHSCTIKFKVTDDSKYLSEDQGDWLKAGGITMDLRDNNNYAALLGVRYNVDKGCYQMTPYVNFSNGKIYNHTTAGKDLPIVNLDFDTDYKVYISVSKNKDGDTQIVYGISYDTGLLISSSGIIIDESLFPVRRLVKSVGNYAGGDKRPSNKFTWEQSFKF